jgi:hypothetical protein
MYITQLLNSFLFAPYRKIAIPNLPKARQTWNPEPARRVLFQHSEDHREFFPLRLADEQVHMLRHDNVTHHVTSLPASCPFQFILESLSCGSGIQ